MECSKINTRGGGGVEQFLRCHRIAFRVRESWCSYGVAAGITEKIIFRGDKQLFFEHRKRGEPAAGDVV